MRTAENRNDSMRVHVGYDPIREFDAHVYYQLENRAEASALRERFMQAFECPEIRVKRLVDRPIGPHPLPMFEINFTRAHLESIKAWLSQNRGAHTVLIHEVTGDDPRDHTAGADWLGGPVPLDFSRLDPSPVSKQFG